VYGHRQLQNALVRLRGQHKEKGELAIARIAYLSRLISGVGKPCLLKLSLQRKSRTIARIANCPWKSPQFI
jgi:hypothetical protein